MLETFTQWDVRVFQLVNYDWAAPWLDAVTPLLSCVPLLWALAGLILFCLILRALWRRNTSGLRRIACSTLLLALCLGATNTLTDWTKKWSDRTRPYHAVLLSRYHENGKWKQRAADYVARTKSNLSFFSGHASNTMALAAGLSALCPPAAPLFYLLPLSVGYSRVYMGKHYPSDVAAGWLAGWLTARLICRLSRRWEGFRNVVFPAA